MYIYQYFLCYFENINFHYKFQGFLEEEIPKKELLILEIEAKFFKLSKLEQDITERCLKLEIGRNFIQYFILILCGFEPLKIDYKFIHGWGDFLYFLQLRVLSNLIANSKTLFNFLIRNCSIFHNEMRIVYYDVEILS